MEESLDENGVVKDYDRPRGALVILAYKLHQENAQYHKYQWRLCVSYKNLNQITCPFAFSIPYCDDAVQDIHTEAMFLIAMYIDSGY